MNFETGVERTIEFDAREVTQYKIIEYSFEIEGVIAQRDHPGGFIIIHMNSQRKSMIVWIKRLS